MPNIDKIQKSPNVCDSMCEILFEKYLVRSALQNNLITMLNKAFYPQECVSLNCCDDESMLESKVTHGYNLRFDISKNIADDFYHDSLKVWGFDLTTYNADELLSKRK